MSALMQEIERLSRDERMALIEEIRATLETAPGGAEVEPLS